MNTINITGAYENRQPHYWLGLLMAAGALLFAVWYAAGVSSKLIMASNTPRTVAAQVAYYSHGAGRIGAQQHWLAAANNDGAKWKAAKRYCNATPGARGCQAVENIEQIEG